jgi:hypothetical protein
MKIDVSIRLLVKVELGNRMLSVLKDRLGESYNVPDCEL